MTDDELYAVPNPYLAFCPECGRTICTRCALLQDEWGSIEKANNWDHAVVNLRRRILAHKRKYHTPKETRHA